MQRLGLLRAQRALTQRQPLQPLLARCHAPFSTALNTSGAAVAAATHVHPPPPANSPAAAVERPLVGVGGGLHAPHGAPAPPSPSGAHTPASPFATRVRHTAYDVTIVGGGMVGSALALALASSPVTRHLRVCLIESVAPAGLGKPLSPSPTIRVSAVTPASAAFFDRLGAWALMAAARVTPYTRMRVWHTLSRGEVEWKLGEMQGDTASRPGQSTASASKPSWDDVSAASLAPPPSAALGHIVENDVIQHSLWARMQALIAEGAVAGVSDPDKQCNLELVAPLKIEQILPGPAAGMSEAAAAAAGVTDWPRVLLSNEQAFSTRLLIGADGPGSLVKQFAGKATESIGWDYGQRAVVATLQFGDSASSSSSSSASSASSSASPPSRHHTAFQRFLPTGPIAFLPCHGNYANLVWSTTPAHAKQLCAQLTPQQFVEAVNKAFRAPAKDFQPGGRARMADGLLPQPLADVADILFPQPAAAASSSASDSDAASDSSPSSSLPPLITGVVGPRLFFPLRFIHASSYVTRRVALVGDAAHVVHPLAGQGVNLGFGDAEELARVIEETVLAGADIGELDSGGVGLASYESRRRAANTKLMAGVDVLGRTFAPQEGPLAAARTWGLTLFNAVPAIKNRAAEFAMGLKLDK